MALNNAQPTLPHHCNMGQSGQSDKTEIKLTDNYEKSPVNSLSPPIELPTHSQVLKVSDPASVIVVI